MILKQFHQVRSKSNMQNCFLGNFVSNAPYLELLEGYQYLTLVLANRARAKWKCCSSFEFFSLLFDLKYALYYIRTSNWTFLYFIIFACLSFNIHISKIKTFLGSLQTPLHSCAEPNWWVKYGRRTAFESYECRVALWTQMVRQRINSEVWI